MKITDIKTAEVRGHGYSCYVRVFTDEGVTGTGECIHGGGGVTGLIRDMAGLLKGDDPLDVDALFVTEAYVNEGPRMKRLRAAPMGRAYRYQRRMAHIIVKGGDKAE